MVQHRGFDPKAWLPEDPTPERPSSVSSDIMDSEGLTKVAPAPGSTDYDILKGAPTRASIEVTWQSERQLFHNISEIARLLTRLELHVNVPPSTLAAEMQADASRASCDAYYNRLDPRNREQVIQLAHQRILERLRGLLQAVEPCGAVLRCRESFGDLLVETRDLDMAQVALGKPILDWVREQRVRLGLRRRNLAPGKAFDEQSELWKLLPYQLRMLVKPTGEEPDGPGFLERWHDALRGPEFLLAQMAELKRVQESATACRVGETNEEEEAVGTGEKKSARSRLMRRITTSLRTRPVSRG